MKVLALLIVVLSVTPVALGQEDQNGAVNLDELNARVSDQITPDGATSAFGFTNLVQPAVEGSGGFGWAVAATLPDYGFVVRDSEGAPVDTFGPSVSAEYDADKGAWSIVGYALEPGQDIVRVGGAQWLAASEAAARNATSLGAQDPMLGPMDNVIDAIKIASAYIAEQVCVFPARPQTLKLFITAGMQFVASAEAGSEVVWNFDTMCPRVYPEGQPTPD